MGHILGLPGLKKYFITLVKGSKEYFIPEGSTIAMGDRDQTQLWIEQGQMEIYNQRAEWGLMNGKLLRENIKAGGILVRSTKQDSCWRQSRVLRYWKWEMKNLIRYPGYQIPRVRESLLNWISRILDETGRSWPRTGWGLEKGAPKSLTQVWKDFLCQLIK